MADFSVVVDKLHQFETADEIADYFRYYGIKANVQDARSCAISEFVQRETGLEGRVITSTTSLALIAEGAMVWDDATVEVEHTKAMHQFVKKFDSGAYPDLLNCEVQQEIWDCVCYCEKCYE